MLNEETRRKLRLLKIGEFVEVIESQRLDEQALALPFDERFQMIVDSVYQQKYNDKVQRLLKAAKLRLPKADIHDIFYTDKRPLKKGIIEEIATCRFVKDKKSIVLQGYPSSGKTFLGCAIGKEGCRQEYRVRYIRLPELLMEYEDRSHMPGGITKVLKKYSAFDIMILDEWLIQALSEDDVKFLFELLERRYDSASTVFCTLYKRADWVRRLGSGAYAESIVERYRFNTLWIETGETNMREIYSRPQEEVHGNA